MWVRLSLIVLLLSGLLAGCGAPPSRQTIHPPRDLNGPQARHIRFQLLALRGRPDRCLTLLNRAQGLSVRREPDVRVSDQCGKFNTVSLLTSPVAFARPPQTTCPLAAGLYLWTRDALAPAAQRHLGQPVRRIETFGTFACRSRNGLPGARISEHATANAIDISAFVLADGRRITVKDGWTGSDERSRRFLRAAMTSGCHYFSVVLGPDSDAFHRDHFHFDLSQWPKCG